MIESLKSFINKNHLFRKDDHLILAISGGLDSMVLLSLMHQLPYKISVAHVNHGLRNEESDNDESFIKSICESLNVPFYSTSIKEALESSTGNLQENARNLRYAYFEKLKAKLDAQWILTAHHQDDAIETMTHNFFRGTGLDGLIGIKLKTQHIVRPLLCFSKETLKTFAETNMISFREDSSNQSDKYRRNYIRHHLLDGPTTLFDHQRNRLQTTLINLQKTAELSNYLISNIKKEIMIKDNDHYKIYVDKLPESEHTSSILYEILKRFGFNATQCDDLSQQLSQTGRKIHSQSYCAIVERDYLKIYKDEDFKNKEIYTAIAKKDQRYVLNSTTTIEFNFHKNYSRAKDLDTLILDADKLEFPLILRQWQNGDSFHPAGMKGKRQKISKTLRNYKVDNSKKSSQLVLVSNNKICALIPFRLAENYKVESETKLFLVVKLITNG